MVVQCEHGYRAVRPLNRTQKVSILLRCKRLDTVRLPPIKLVINANARDLRPLRRLIFSLLSVGHRLWDDTVIVLGGNGANVPPMREPLGTLAGLLFDPRFDNQTREPRASSATPVVVRTATHSFDYHGLDALWRYRHNSLIAAQGFLYTVDSTLAHPGFPKRLGELARNFRRTESKRCSMEVHTVPLPNANLAAFGIGALLAYGNNFGRLSNMSKAEAISIEKGCEGSRARNLIEFASSVATHHARQPCGAMDIYNTGDHPRLCWYYHGLELYKFHDAHRTVD